MSVRFLRNGRISACTCRRCPALDAHQYTLHEPFLSLVELWQQVRLIVKPLERRLNTKWPCRLPAMASTTGNEAVELSSFASGTGKSSSERLKVIQV